VTMTVESSIESGRAARRKVARTSHADFEPAAARPDPVALLADQNTSRLEWLVPIRHSRMRVSPFTFYRGAARIMATDLAASPHTELDVQLGGDAHLSNFGAYASPERQLVFDANDFDETLRGPCEWDLKRLAVSLMIAAQNNGMTRAVCRKVTSEVTTAYASAMAEHARQGQLEVWYDHITIDDVRSAVGTEADFQARLDRFEKRARSKTSLQALKKLTVEENGRRRIRSDPPVLYPLRALPDETDPDVLEATVITALDTYKETLADDRRWILERYHPVDFGLKVVGVGSVGTRCVIILLEGRTAGDPLFLQAKEATASVLEEHLGPSSYTNHGRRVVEGQRMVQAESDIFLGWTEAREGRHFYLRQLRDWKGSAEVENLDVKGLRFYAAMCGRTLARGHARSGDPVAISAYIGTSDRFAAAITAFSEKYALRNAEDFQRFEQAIADGHLATQAE